MEEDWRVMTKGTGFFLEGGDDGNIKLIIVNKFDYSDGLTAL